MISKPELIYIATRLTADHPIDYLYNLKQSLKAGAEIWRKGHYPMTPGLDFMLYFELDGDYGKGGRFPYEMGLRILEGCDSILIHNGLEDSSGVQKEHERAKEIGLKIYYSLDEIEDVE